jgi:hypothetical protein
LLKGEDELLERRAVSEFARGEQSLSLEDHWRTYQWCQIERGILDAAFLSSQEMGSAGAAKLDLHWCVENSARIVLRKYRELLEAGRSHSPPSQE